MTLPVIVDPNLVASVREDLTYLAQGCKQPVTEASVKRASAVLRRLVLDQNATLQAGRKMLGLQGQPRIQAFDLEAELASRYRGVDFAFAGGAQVGGALMALTIMRYMPLPPPRFKIREYLLSQYMQATAMVVMGKPVSRSHLVRYVANKLGGVHYDPHRTNSKEDRLFKLLDAHRERLHVAGVDIVHYEVLAIGQHLLRSPQVAELLPADSEALKNIPGLEAIRASCLGTP
ncbi:hypothetical protein AB0J37_00020 [Microbispora rosea]|uniref:hypothetical protein n=1 Tax=Microbispora rosea TaxID=58117 RepID=UPI003419ABEA